MKIEKWEKMYKVQAIWNDGPTAEETRVKLAPKAPAYQFKLEEGSPRSLHEDVKGLTSAIYTAESLLRLTNGVGIRAEVKINDLNLFDLLRKLSIGIKHAVEILRPIKYHLRNRRPVKALNGLEETLRLDQEVTFLGC